MQTLKMTTLNNPDAFDAFQVPVSAITSHPKPQVASSNNPAVY
jgi:hypothetical protein